MKPRSHRFTSALLLPFALGLAVSPGRAADPELAVRELLQKRCADCHSPETDDEKPTLSRATDLLSLRTDPHYVTVGSAANSPLFQRVTLPAADKKRMPKSTRDDPRPPLTESELAILKEWIQPGGTVNRAFITDESVAKSVLQDLKNAGRDARFYRYLTLHNLANAGDADAALETYRAALSKLFNSLSWERRITKPVAIDSARMVLRFDLRDYGWSAAKWERIASAYPYALVLGKRFENEIEALAGTATAYVRGDWFAFATSQPPFYDEILGLPPTDRELERNLLHVDVTANQRNGTAQRAGLVKSGVSDFNRMIERHPQAHGAYWKSYDFRSNDGKQKLLRNPLGPVGLNARFAFAHNGGELIWNLPNGLQAYLLATDKGTRIARAPTDIVKDPSRPDVAIINGISCLSCHVHGMKVAPKGNLVDEVRPAAGALDLTEAESALLQRLYPEPADFAALVESDEQRFRAALAATGVTGETEPIAVLYNRFKQPITLATVSAEFGVPSLDLQQRLQESSIEELRVFGEELKAAGAFSRKSFIEQFRLTVEGLQLGRLRPFTPVAHEDFFPGGVLPDDHAEVPVPAKPVEIITHPDGERTRLLQDGAAGLRALAAPGSLRAPSGAAGAHGAGGPDGFAGDNGGHRLRPGNPSRNGKPGGPGGRGGDGRPGTSGKNAPNLVVRVEELRFQSLPALAHIVVTEIDGTVRFDAVWDPSQRLVLDARGGDGGAGGHGGSGGSGGSGGYGGYGDSDFRPPYGGDGGQGGQGGDGGHGAPGGNGGDGSRVQVEISGNPGFVGTVRTNLQFNVAGGLAGRGGSAGAAGRGGPVTSDPLDGQPRFRGDDSKPGAPGTPGRAGQDGQPGAAGAVSFH